MQGNPETEEAMAPLMGFGLGSRIYNPIYEAVSQLLRLDCKTRADRLVAAIAMVLNERTGGRP